MIGGDLEQASQPLRSCFFWGGFYGIRVGSTELPVL